MTTETSLVPANGAAEFQALIQSAKQHNDNLFATGQTPELPGQSDWIPARQAIGQPFVIRTVEYMPSNFKDGEYAKITAVFANEPDKEQVITASGGYLLNQLRRLYQDTTMHLWVIRELTMLRGEPVKQFNGMQPLVIDYANRPDSNLVEAGPF